MNNKATYKNVVGRIIGQQDGKPPVWEETVTGQGGKSKKVVKFAVRPIKDGAPIVTVTLWEEAGQFHRKVLEQGALVFCNGKYSMNAGKYHNLSITEKTDLWSCRTEAALVQSLALSSIIEEDPADDMEEAMPAEIATAEVDFGL
jgi:hypothetical protein